MGRNIVTICLGSSFNLILPSSIRRLRYWVKCKTSRIHFPHPGIMTLKRMITMRIRGYESFIPSPLKVFIFSSANSSKYSPFANLKLQHAATFSLPQETKVYTSSIQDFSKTLILSLTLGSKAYMEPVNSRTSAFSLVKSLISNPRSSVHFSLSFGKRQKGFPILQGALQICLMLR